MQQKLPNQLIKSLANQVLYDKLIQQIQKDFELSGLNIEISSEISPRELFEFMRNTIKQMINYQFDTLLNLFYRIDLRLSDIRHQDTKNLDEMAHDLAVSIIEKTWKKVYLRDQYS